MASMHPPSPCWIGRLHRPKARAKAGTKGGPFYFWKLVIVSGELYIVKSNVICVHPVIYVYIYMNMFLLYAHVLCRCFDSIYHLYTQGSVSAKTVARASDLWLCTCSLSKGQTGN